MAEKLTVIIPCKDEEANIRGCLHSAAKVADEIIVADSGSTDRTLDFVRREGGGRIIERDYVNSGDFKNWAIPQASHRWVLILDADERIPDRLAAEIRDVLRRGPSEDGYWIYRTSFFMGHRVRFSGWQNDRVLRLFHRDRGRYQGETDHAEVVLTSGRGGRLKHRMLHFSYWTYHDYFQRMERYSTYQALKWQQQGRRVNLLKLFFNLPLRFLQLYILRLGFLDGVVGLQVCTLTAAYSFAKQACLWQRLCGRSPTGIHETAGDLLIDVVVEGDQPMDALGRCRRQKERKPVGTRHARGSFSTSANSTSYVVMHVRTPQASARDLLSTFRRDQPENDEATAAEHTVSPPLVGQDDRIPTP